MTTDFVHSPVLVGFLLVGSLLLGSLLPLSPPGGSPPGGPGGGLGSTGSGPPVPGRPEPHGRLKQSRRHISLQKGPEHLCPQCLLHLFPGSPDWCVQESPVFDGG